MGNSSRNNQMQCYGYFCRILSNFNEHMYLLSVSMFKWGFLTRLMYSKKQKKESLKVMHSLYPKPDVSENYADININLNTQVWRFKNTYF